MLIGVRAAPLMLEYLFFISRWQHTAALRASRPMTGLRGDRACLRAAGATRPQCTGKGNAALSPVRASILREPAGDIGARRSVVNTYRDGVASRWSLRKAVGQPGDRLAKG